MKLLHRSFGFIFSIAAILILMVTAFDLAVYGDYGFFQKEYEKYEVLEDLNMEMDDVMEVTVHMMEYLRDGNDDMQIVTTVAGESREFFNGQDLFHMEEVKVIFMNLFRVRTISLVVLLITLGVLIATKAGTQTIFRCFQVGLGLFFGIAAALGAVVATNFSKAFVIFHHIFFDNDLWLFDPRTDLMINMLPEGLFMDFTVRILICFVILLAVFEAALLLIRHLARKKTGNGNADKEPGSKKSAGMAVKTMGAILAFCLCTMGAAEPALAADLTDLPDWPKAPGVQADAAVLIDAKSGAVLYGKDMHGTYAPASITKVLTALIACEESSMSDTVTFSRRAVYDLPWDSSIVGFSQDEKVNMKDVLYGLMLKSGNEAAHGIAEHVSGTIEDFALRMNERAAEAGALNSHFVNPHGLHDEDHYTTAYDMAMILRAAVQNDTFLEIASTTYYEIAPTNINKEGYAFSAGHRMINKNRSEYYQYAVAGKTGYTSKAGNTLVTYAKKDNMELICVILHSRQTQYTDTRALLDYGFTNFTTYNAAEEDTSYSDADFTFFSFLDSTFENTPMSVELDDCHIILPSTIPFSSVTSRLDYETTSGDGATGSQDSTGTSAKNILGYVIYEYEGIEVGRSPLRLISRPEEGNGSQAILPGSALNTPEQNPGTNLPGTDVDSPPETAPSDNGEKVIAINIWHLLGYIFLAILAILVIGLLIHYYSPKQRRMRKAKQMRRGISSERRRKRKRDLR